MGEVSEQERGAGVTRRDRGTPMSAFDYPLPAGSIAQRPVEPRSAARLLVAPEVSPVGVLEHRRVAELPVLLGPGDVVVVNETRVLAARLGLVRSTGGRAEVLLLEPVAGTAGGVAGWRRADAAVGVRAEGGGSRWYALVRPGRRLPPGTLLYACGPDGRPTGEPVVEVGVAAPGADDGRRLVTVLDRSAARSVGEVPLPPYIHEPLDDPDRYQTVFARDEDEADRSVAAPTAGLHLTREVIDGIVAAGASVHRVELAIGLDTFRPVTTEVAEDHVIHTERYRVPAATLEACRAARRVVAVGTTVVRALESAAATGALEGRTDLFIHGSYPFALVDVVLTNFHLPRSSLLLLVEAFCGPRWRDLYATALAEGYRFLSFGDAMLVGRSYREPT
ncbi:MAG: S-adenosylmethionine:tRNA ribosyltransferase-isomerase [Actinomycetota bacterium]|nr:S-adenosylmethionine:tRNA ribosyltransferase-isomerase [Actinomycetota bacterium]